MALALCKRLCSATVLQSQVPVPLCAENSPGQLSGCVCLAWAARTPCGSVGTPRVLVLFLSV